MKIDFHVPTGHTHTPGPDPDLRVIQAAISSGGTDLLERVTELRDAVYLLRHCTQIAPATVLETLAEVDGVVVSQVEEQFQKRRVGLSLPLTNTEQDLCAGMNSLYGQIAKAYSSLIPDRCSELSNDELLVIPEAAYGTLHYLYELLLCAYQAYQNVPNNTWRQIHALYRRACALGIEDEPIAGPQTAHATVKFLYQHTLLIGLSNPYHFAFRAIRLIDDYVGTHVTQTKLTHSVSRSTNECLFVVDPRIDYPAIPMLSRVRSGNTSECLILDTFEISVDLHHKIKALCGASERPSDRSLAGFSEAERLETLKALLTQWGFHPIRSLARRQSSGKCELAVGLGAVSFVLNGSEPVSMFDEQTEAYAADNVIKGSFGQQQFTQRTQFSLSGGWTLVDESKQGARLLLAETANAGSQIRVGELVALRVDSGDGWRIGTVRWAKSRNGNTFEIGMYRLGDAMQALPAAVKPIQLSAESTGVCSPALVMTDSGDTSKQMLVVPKGVYQPQGTVLVKFKDRERVTRIRRLELSTRAFDYFAVQFDQTNRDESLRIRLPA